MLDADSGDDDDLWADWNRKPQTLEDWNKLVAQAHRAEKVLWIVRRMLEDEKQ